MRFGARSLLAALADASPAFGDTPVPVEGGFWRKLLIALADASPAFTGGPVTTARTRAPSGKRAVVGGESAARRVLPPERRSSPDQPGVLRLPRFDRTAVRTAGTASVRRQRQETVSGDVRYVLRDAGRDRLEVIAESADVVADSAVLPVTVVTPEGAEGYLLVFRPEGASLWAAAAYVPGIRDWADVFIHAMRDRASLGDSDSDTVERSIRAARDPAVPEWQEIAQEREAEDPVRQAIERALRA
jgi:hypothetical protein